jgi:hypothetical protein
MNGLMLHCGANGVTLDDVRAVETPEPSFRGEKGKRIFHPIPHALLHDTVIDQLGESGYEVQESSHGLTKGGDRYFGLIQVRHNSEPEVARDHGLVIGLRNAHDGMFQAATALGARVFVCDNLSFSGEVVVGRRHTRNILRDLPG